ncbi:GIY-YIG nuclease family protein [Cytobacillus sp. FSL R7-0696]|uniref:GIY-YIG nuclease family protein n=1 Tax=Cytobacillus sp. FSL R7-0696 TaxID=2921691 RepID=UPI0030FA5B04
MIEVSLPEEIIQFKRWELVNYRYEIETKARNKGIYVLRGKNDKVLYVGKSIRLYKRLTDHTTGRGESQRFSHLIEDITVYFVAEDYEIDIYESFAINFFQPKFNRDKVFYRKVDETIIIEYDEACELLDEKVSERNSLKEERKRLTPTFDVDDTLVDSEERDHYLLGEFLRLTTCIDELDVEIQKLRDKCKKLSLLLDV